MPKRQIPKVGDRMVTTEGHHGVVTEVTPPGSTSCRVYLEYPGRPRRWHGGPGRAGHGGIVARRKLRATTPYQESLHGPWRAYLED